MTNNLTSKEKSDFKYGIAQHPWIERNYEKEILETPNEQLIQELLKREDIEGSFIQVLQSINERIQEGLED